MMEARLAKSIRGYLFETNVASFLRQENLIITYFKLHVNSALELTVTINKVVPLVTELKEMDCNVLYMLKPFHKVIDGVFLSDN